MKNLWKIITVLLLAASVITVVVSKKKENSQITGNNPQNSAVEIQSAGETGKLPRLVDLGSDKCIPCKMMAPLLEELNRDYTETFTVEIIDVFQNPDAAKNYGISVIPTQIFLDGTGKELFRHEGYFPKEDILSKWRELGVEPVKNK